jgi:hypothetical protein
MPPRYSWQGEAFNSYYVFFLTLTLDLILSTVIPLLRAEKVTHSSRILSQPWIAKQLIVSALSA